MEIYNILVKPIQLILREPKVVLPGVIHWIENILVFFLLIGMTSKIALLFQAKTIDSAFASNQLAEWLIKVVYEITPYLAGIFLIVLIYILIEVVLAGVYTEFIRQNKENEEISVLKAFSQGVTKFPKLLVNYIVIGILAFIAVVFLLLLVIAFFIINPILGIIMLVIEILLFLVILAVFLTIFWLIPPYSMFTEKSGFKLVSEIASKIRANPMLIVAFIATAIGFSFLAFISLILSIIPLIGLGLSLLYGLFIQAWLYMTGAQAFYEYELNKTEVSEKKSAVKTSK